MDTDSTQNQEGHTSKKFSSSKDMKNTLQTNLSEVECKSASNNGPTVIFFWVWNWFATLPKTVTNIYAEIKSGELLARFTLLDAMMQFIVAVATSCHPQEEGMSGDSEELNKSNSDSPGKIKNDGLKVFGGQGRTLRSRVVETQS